MNKEPEDPVSKKRRLNNERQMRWRARQTPEANEIIREKDAASHRKQIEEMTPQQIEAYKTAHATSQQRHINRLSSQQIEALRVANTTFHRLTQLRQNEAIQKEAINFVEERTDEHNCGPLNCI